MAAPLDELHAANSVEPATKATTLACQLFGVLVLPTATIDRPFSADKRLIKKIAERHNLMRCFVRADQDDRYQTVPRSRWPLGVSAP
jgi:hypothetical protein